VQLDFLRWLFEKCGDLDENDGYQMETLSDYVAAVAQEMKYGVTACRNAGKVEEMSSAERVRHESQDTDLFDEDDLDGEVPVGEDIGVPSPGDEMLMDLDE